MYDVYGSKLVVVWKTHKGAQMQLLRRKMKACSVLKWEGNRSIGNRVTSACLLLVPKFPFELMTTIWALEISLCIVWSQPIKGEVDICFSWRSLLLIAFAEFWINCGWILIRFSWIHPHNAFVSYIFSNLKFLIFFKVPEYFLYGTYSKLKKIAKT